MRPARCASSSGRPARNSTLAAVRSMKACSSDALTGASSCRGMSCSNARSPTWAGSSPVTSSSPAPSSRAVPPAIATARASLAACGERARTERAEFAAMNSATEQSRDQPAAADDEQVVGGQRHLATSGGWRRTPSGPPRPAPASGCGSSKMPSGSSPLTGSSNISDRRVAEQRRGDAQPLAHAEGEAPGPLAGHVGQPGQREHLARPAGAGCRWPAARHSRWLGADRPPCTALASSSAPTSRIGARQLGVTGGRSRSRFRSWAGPGRGSSASWWTCRRRWGRGTR